MLVQILITALLAQACVGIVYDSFTAKQASQELLEHYRSQNLLRNCTIDIQLPCNEKEGRRLDGSCSDLEDPTSGTYHTPLERLLQPVYAYVTKEKSARGDNKRDCPSRVLTCAKNILNTFKDNEIKVDFQEFSFNADEPRNSVSGGPLPLERRVRKRVLLEGKASDPEFTQLLHFVSAICFADIGSVHDTINYLMQTQYCCEKEGKSDHMCAPIEVPIDDDTHRFSGISCLNLTRPMTFQNLGCAAASTGHDRFAVNTPLFENSFIYRSVEPMPEYRAYKDGLLKYEEEDGSMWPISQGPHNVTSCYANVAANGEKRCFGPIQGSILPVTMTNVWFYRLHNIIAAELAKINPHWSDDKIFYTTRDICIAINNQLQYYELMPILLGKKTIARYALNSVSNGFRDPYNRKVKPKASFEYMYGMRWFHIVQESIVKLYNEDNHFLREDRAVNLTLRTGYLSIDDNFAKLTRGLFLHYAGGHDRAVDPDMSGVGLGGMQHSTDLTTADMRKGRLFGVQPYVNYLEFCGSKKPENWKDLAKHLGWEFVEQLKELYKDVNDVDLLVGLWGEGRPKDGYLPPTLSCIVAKQMERAMVADKHWYERPNRPYAFTIDQLKEIRKASFAALLCTVEPKLKTITRDPLRRVSAKNLIVSCKDIEKWNLEAWRDDNRGYRRSERKQSY